MIKTLLHDMHDKNFAFHLLGISLSVGAEWLTGCQDNLYLSTTIIIE